ncbi:MAG: thioredoxin family protein [Candidatus Methanosuratincola sp.]
MKLEIFTSETCANCKVLKKHLKELMAELGEDYGETVVERSIDDSDVMAELLMLNVDSIPVMRIGGKVYEWQSIKDKAGLKKILTEHKK